MDKSNKILSDIVVFNKYAKYVPREKRRETWDEIVNRYLTMMVKKYPHITEHINKQGKFLKRKESSYVYESCTVFWGCY